VQGLACYVKKKVASTNAKMHHAAHYHLYQHFSCIIMGYRNVCVQVPDCIEKYIKLAYHGDGKFCWIQGASYQQMKHNEKIFLEKIEQINQYLYLVPGRVHSVKHHWLHTGSSAIIHYL